MEIETGPSWGIRPFRDDDDIIDAALDAYRHAGCPQGTAAMYVAVDDRRSYEVRQRQVADLIARRKT